MDEKAYKLLDDGARAVLGALLEPLGSIEEWRVEQIEDAVRGYADKAAIKLGEAAQPLRAALTGRTASPGIFDVLFVLGKDEGLARIRDQAR